MNISWGDSVLILASDGLRNDKVMGSFKRYLSDNSKKAALITTAFKPFGGKDPNVDFHKEAIERLGLEVNLFDMEEQDVNGLKLYDIIVIMGGNPFYLLDVMRKTNCKTLFSKLIKNKIVVSISAGSMVLGETVGVAYEFTPEMNVGLDDFTGLKITEVNICPHKTTFLSNFENSVERIKSYEKKTGIKITCIDDGQAIFVTDKGTFAI